MNPRRFGSLRGLFYEKRKVKSLTLLAAFIPSTEPLDLCFAKPFYSILF